MKDATRQTWIPFFASGLALTLALAGCTPQEPKAVSKDMTGDDAYRVRPVQRAPCLAMGSNQSCDQAEKRATELLRENPESVEARIMLASAFIGQRRYTPAEQLLGPLMHTPEARRDASIARMMGTVQLKEGRFENAIGSFFMAIEVSKDDCESFRGLTEAYKRQGYSAPLLPSAKELSLSSTCPSEADTARRNARNLIE